MKLILSLIATTIALAVPANAWAQIDLNEIRLDGIPINVQTWIERQVPERPTSTAQDVLDGIRDQIDLSGPLEHAQSELDKLSEQINDIDWSELDPSAYFKKQPWYRDLQTRMLSQLIEKPDIIVCREDLPGPPVWYVNGIFTTRAEAIEAANQTATRMKRRVHLLHNRTSAEGPDHVTGLESNVLPDDDITECIYDRAFPVAVVARLDRLAVGAVSGGEKLQANPTTRKLAYVLYHAEQPVSLVTHSQGCLIARNAFFTLSLLSRETKVRQQVAWVAAGLPLNNNEIWPEPKRMTILDYRNDPVSKVLGLRGGGVDYNSAHHNFLKNYVNQLIPAQIWP